jgi:hypothetical protein
MTVTLFEAGELLLRLVLLTNGRVEAEIDNPDLELYSPEQATPCPVLLRLGVQEEKEVEVEGCKRESDEEEREETGACGWLVV